jgi:hypothetical protein
MTKSVTELLWDDYSTNYTPDLASLRYKGPIPVLLIGEYQEWAKMNDFLRTLGLSSYADYDTVAWSVFTKAQFVQLKAEKPNPYTDILALQSDVSHLTPLRVRGRLITVSHKAIRKLDFNFYNTSDTHRIICPLEDSYGNGPLKHNWAYTYVFNKRTFLDDTGGLRKGVSVANTIQISTEKFYGATAY